MKLVARHHEPAWLDDEGVVVAGHSVERVASGRPGTDLRYLVRSPDGTLRMLVVSQRAFVDRQDRARFRQLGAARVALDHPAAIPVRAVSQYANRPVLIADMYPERTFADLLAREAPLEPARAIALLAPVAEALDTAHAAGLTHRALSPDALLLFERDELVLDDFGLLRSDAGDVAYRSPEQAWGNDPTPASNVYSLAALVFHALTGEPPYRGDRTTTYRHIADAPPKLSERAPRLGRAIDSVVASGLAKDPLDRPYSAGELIRAVAEALGVPPPRSAAPQAATPRLTLVPDVARVARVRRRRRPVRAAAAAIGTAVACGALAAALVTPLGDNGSSAAPAPAAGTAWKQLAGKRAELRDRLAAAKTPQEQAEAASDLSSLYGAASDAGGSRALAAAATDAYVAYGRLATAAGINDGAGYAEAARGIERAEARLAAAASPR